MAKAKRNSRGAASSTGNAGKQNANPAGKRSVVKSNRPTYGPALKRLNALVKDAGYFQTFLTVSLGDGDAEIEVNALKDGACGDLRFPGSKSPFWSVAPSLAAIFLKLAGQASHGIPQIDSIRLRASKGALPRRELQRLVLAAWCEAFRVEVPTDAAIKELKGAKKTTRDSERDALLGELAKGVEGVKRWNVQMATKKARDRDRDFRNTKLPMATLKNVDFSRLDLRGSNFDRAELAWADLSNCNLCGATFVDADLSHAKFIGARCNDADFSGADLSHALLESSKWLRAKLSGANLAGANLRLSDLRGVDLTGASVPDTTFCANEYDELTRWPEGFQLPKTLIWKGEGDDPAVARVIMQSQAAGPLDLPKFLERLQQRVVAAKYDKALAMLKADRFKLFAQVEPESMIGVVKSQTDPDLVYSCRLGADGKFACCTQNLNICGGLRGSLCKHLLVLIIGLANGGELDPTKVDVWIETSRLRKPELEKDKMSEAFLRYKGAEAGELDCAPHRDASGRLLRAVRRETNGEHKRRTESREGEFDISTEARRYEAGVCGKIQTGSSRTGEEVGSVRRGRNR